MAGTLKDLRRILRQFKAISDSTRIPGEFQVQIVGFSDRCNCFKYTCNFIMLWALLYRLNSIVYRFGSRDATDVAFCRIPNIWYPIEYFLFF